MRKKPRRFVQDPSRTRATGEARTTSTGQIRMDNHIIRVFRIYGLRQEASWGSSERQIFPFQRRAAEGNRVSKWTPVAAKPAVPMVRYFRSNSERFSSVRMAAPNAITNGPWAIVQSNGSFVAMQIKMVATPSATNENAQTRISGRYRGTSLASTQVMTPCIA